MEYDIEARETKGLIGSSHGQTWGWFLGLQGFTKEEVEGLRFQKEESGLPGWVHTCARGGVWFNFILSMARLSMCVSTCLSFRESTNEISSLPFPVLLLACFCVPSFIFSGATKRNFNDPVSPGVQSVTESAETLRPYAQPWVWTGPQVGSMFLSWPEKHLWRLALPDQSHKGHLQFNSSSLHPPF